ncbi:hypothetical protein ACQEU5_09110 [Marinactinospora thermotolerans]|uniref:Uncharacterized protein n=1 Tax=Marinactinospora thermotolerans DSM 45154 TaxID=1122192 RepID=A0A1T4T3G4_9ACTN|nr:hypothetical protein [Marinactinospora thermotolerans]SKA34698.1 hypothetical protein SAMN02745673_04353 [Marinactinospora thermotolerans DSM 45154]
MGERSDIDWAELDDGELLDGVLDVMEREELIPGGLGRVLADIAAAGVPEPREESGAVLVRPVTRLRSVASEPQRRHRL